MKVTFINRMMGILRGGGEHVDVNLARELQKLGAQARFVVGRRILRLDEPLDEFDTHYITTPYLRSISYPLDGSSFHPFRSIGSRVRCLDDYLFVNAAFRYLNNDYDTDVYQICTLPVLGARLARTGRKTVIHWPGPPGRQAIEYAKRCSAVFAHGKSYEHAKAFIPQTQYIPAGCDIDLFKPLPQRDATEGKCRFLFVGRCIPVKNLEFLIDGFVEAKRRRPGISLCIVGDGALLPKLKARASGYNLGDSINFPGTQTGESLATQYQKADCFTLLSHYESFGIVVLEAMSSGLPVILSNVGYLPTFINSYQAGTLIEPGNVSELAEAMIWWVDNPSERIATGLRNRCTAEKNFSWTSSAKKLLLLYESLLP